MSSPYPPLRYRSYVNEVLQERTVASQEGALDYLANSAALQQFKQVGEGRGISRSGHLDLDLPPSISIPALPFADSGCPGIRYPCQPAAGSSIPHRCLGLRNRCGFRNHHRLREADQPCCYLWAQGS